MIEKLKRRLFIRYTLILLGVSLLIFGGGYVAYRSITEKVLFSSLRDYLQEEVYEFKQNLGELIVKPERVAVVARNDALHFFSYGFIDGNMVRQEQPDGKIGTLLTEKMNSWSAADGDIKTIKMRESGERWRFLAVSESWQDAAGEEYRVVVLLNISAYVYITHRYKSYGLLAVGLLCLLSVLAAMILAANAVKPLAEAYRQQKEFVSDASHELKTPLSVLLTYTEILQKQPQNQKALQVLKDETKNMSALVENLLALARLENDEPPVGQALNLAQILLPLVERLETVHPRQQPLEVVCPADIEVTMLPQHLERLLTILLDNALKYTPADKRISVTVQKDDKNVKIVVADEGCGIAPEDLPHIFERFYRADKGRNRQSGGFGLGLALAQDIVRKYQGRIEVSSNKGRQGTVFTVVL